MFIEYKTDVTCVSVVITQKVVDQPEEKEGEGATEGVTEGATEGATEGEKGGDEKNKEEAAVSEVPLSTGGEDFSGSVIA